MHKHPVSRFVPFALLSLFALLPLVTTAQSALPVTRTAEYDIGVRCPLGLTLDLTQTQVWVLMDNCFNGRYGLQGYQLADGTPITTDLEQYAEVLEPLRDRWLYSDTRPFAFTPDGVVDIRYNDPDTYSGLNLRFTLDGSEPPATESLLLTNEVIADLIPDYAGYPETTSYNHDHTLAFVSDTSAVYIVDLIKGEILFQIDSGTMTDFSRAYFSTDGQLVYLSTLVNPDNMDDYSSTLASYRLSDGELVKSYDIPTFLNVVSPDNRYVIGVDSEETLMVTDLETGVSSEQIIYSEPPRPLSICYNSGLPAPTGLDMQTSGKLYVRDIIWLPDSSGFVTVNSGQGQGLGGGRTCIFEYSRMRVYAVG